MFNRRRVDDDGNGLGDDYRKPATLASAASTQMKTDYGWCGDNGTNSSGFSGLPGQMRQLNGTFFTAGDYGNFGVHRPMAQTRGIAG